MSYGLCLCGDHGSVRITDVGQHNSLTVKSEDLHQTEMAFTVNSGLCNYPQNIMQK